MERAKASRPKPVLQPVAVGDELYNVEVVRLDGMEWASIMAECPPTDEKGARLGYDSNKAALIACKRHSRLLDVEGEPVTDADWGDLFAAISGVEIQAIAAVWWALNMADPNQKVSDLKKSLAGGDVTS